MTSARHTNQTAPAPRDAWHPWLWAAPALLTLIFIGLLALRHGGSVSGIAHWPEQHAVFLAWNASFAAVPAQWWSAITLLGDSSVLLALLAVFVLGKPQVWAAALASAPLGGLLSISIKSWAYMPRPAAVLDSSWFNIIGPVLHQHSFPSGHALSAFAATVAVLATCAARPRSSRDWALIALGLLAATCVALSRVAVGAHWPLDLAAGATFGWLAGLSGAALARHTGWWRWLFSGSGRQAVGLGLIVWGGLLWMRPHESRASVVVFWVAGVCAISAGFDTLSAGRFLRVWRLPFTAGAPARQAPGSLGRQSSF